MHALSDYKAKCALSGLSFQFFNSDEIERLSVKEITNPQSIDRLLNPIKNGLYDLALGPLDKNDICLTCGLDYFTCPGHYGHINLVLPVFNPIVFKELVKLLRASCESCNMLLTTKLEKDYFWALMTINNHGFNHKLEQIHNLYHKILNDTDEKLAAKISFRGEFEKLVNQIIENEANGHENYIKNSVKEKIDILREFFDVKLKQNRQICLNCGMPLRQLRAEHHSKLFYAKGASKRQLKKAIPTQKMISMDEDLAPTDEIDDLKKETDKLNLDENQTQEEQLESVAGQLYLTPIEAKKLIKKLIANEKEIVELLFGIDNESKDRDLVCLFFYDKISVAPSKYRPISQFKDQRFENAQTVQLSKILQENIILREILMELIKENEKAKLEEVISEAKIADEKKKGLKIQERLQNSWLKLQTLVNTIYDSELDKINTDTPNGVKQLLEKKEGLFRKHMMGKRVNYAGRSVISPDLYIGVDEVGIPEVFAKKLTYPQPVNSINFWEMRQLVLNGPDVYPGASYVQYGNGQILKLKNKDYESRLAIAKQLLTPDSSIDSNLDIKIVHRHLRNGDVLLFNRQPTLHRPSIQAHKARVLPGEKTLRLHYSNCNAYNADFDGDEMNAHLPQNEIARSEAYNLLLANEHYLVPKDGKPLAGLIHDHVISGVTLTMRDRFFDKHDYQYLVYNAFGDVKGKMKLLPPAILKPKALWTGKQVISTIIHNILPNKRACLNLVGKAKVGEKTWYRIHEARAPRWSKKDTQSDIECMSESYILIREGNLLCGVLDKAHYGSSTYSLVHCCYELFGGDTAGKLLTCFGKVFTTFIQFRGFTLGVEDILLTPEASKPRAKLLKKSKKCGYEVIHKVFQQCDANDHESIKEAYMKAHMSPDDSYMKEIDLAYKGKVDSIQNTLVNLCFPGGLAKRFPYNNLQLMIQSGAKGSTVNSMQMSCLLGQQELEGRRPRLMPNGNTLPSFLPYDPNPNSGGFICGSFMTGLTPQEYFFHCMAGREGLVDTAVKTSRSGYLQRCLVKHLEGIMVNYDLTVRDSDGSVIQFQYGEDSLSIEKTQFLNDRQFPFLIDNYSIITGNKDEMDKIQSICHYDLVDKTIKKTKEWRLKHGKNKRTGPFINFCEHMSQSTDVQAMKFEDRTKYLKEEWKKLNKEERKVFNKGKYKQRLPITAEFNADRFLGAISENLQDKIDKYIYDYYNCFSDSPHYSSLTSLAYSLNTDKFRELIYLKSLKSCITPGDGVGVLAAQSIGEPSTQMTLNTFHFAGRGDMNVTLGIPRLREILMVASPNIKTPSMEIPVYSHREDQADKLKSLFTRTLLWDCLQDVEIKQELVVSTDSSKECSWKSTIRFKFLPEEEIKTKVNETLRLYEILAYIEAKFFKNLCISINKKYNQISSSSLLHASSVRDKSMKNFRNIRLDEDGGNDGIDEDDAEDAMESGGSDGAKLLEKINDELEYVGEEEEKDEVGDQEESESDTEMDTEQLNQANNTGGETTDDESSEKKEVEVKALKRKTKKIDQTRINNVINISGMIESYTYDPENKEWCEIGLKLDASKPRLDLYTIIQKEAKSFYIAKIEGIKRCFVNKSKVPSDNGCLKMVTEGINIKAAIKYSDLLDISRLYLNDIHKMSSTFGIEAAVKVIINEIKQVFGAYGINVDYRHLSLIADYMTFEGTYKPFNRIGIKSNASPFQKMSFETCLGFFKDACLMGQKETLESPSARLVTGRMVHTGTGIFDVVTKII